MKIKKKVYKQVVKNVFTSGYNAGVETAVCSIGKCLEASGLLDGQDSVILSEILDTVSLAVKRGE